MQSKRRLRAALGALLVLGAGAACSSPDAARTEVSLPQRPPALAARALDGSTVDIGAALAGGRSVMLVFWQTWCESCLEEAPELAAAAREHAAEWLLVGVVPGPDAEVDDGEVARLSAELRLPYAHVRDRDLAWSDAFAVAGTPTLVALRPDGTAGWRASRPPADWSALHGALRAALGKR